MILNFLSQHTGDVEIKNEINDEMYSQSLNIDSQMNEFVDNSIKTLHLFIIHPHCII